MHTMLAFSARHLASLHPERSDTYQHLAVTLQTQGITHFNAFLKVSDVNQSNCVAVLGFSSALGHHLLADILAVRDPGGLPAFIVHCVRCMEMNRGIYMIAKTAWPLLMGTELQSILLRSSEFTSRRPRGSHCDEVRQLVDGSRELPESDKLACRVAIRYLQIGFDAILDDEEECGYRYQMIFSWSMLASPEFTSLLASRGPEVSIILAYYALLLHFGRSMWQVGDAGRRILGMISDYLAVEWQHWLDYPKAMMAGSSGPAS
ncbi:hypothetical protein B0A55_11801 [Friedmanniomyces simplex]|uniref:Uncharacterized protein n=1 Tax=Friedmanniomyces simplex TaxID=329884 RepID=A0A4U0WIL6_9PEZI|nr:hypothetical protein B0A55_11801 [Friedmanniomyces simplex]